MSITGRVHSVESCGTVDGPGIRYIVFLQGCQFRCLYCHNRDTWHMDGGKEMTADEIIKDASAYRHFFNATGGGITATGGEVLLQTEFVSELFAAAKAEGLHTCLDTNGFARHYTPALEKLLDNTDLVLLDIKQIDEAKHKALTSITNQYTLAFARHLAERNIPTWLRYVVVPGWTDETADAELLADFAKDMPNIEKVELLPYHELGAHKWKTLGVDYPLAGTKPPSGETMEAIKKLFTDRGLDAYYSA